jgi:FtsZ-binding cell division protein ZapB
MMDSELQWRASTLHSNASVLSKQAQDVQRATDGLRRENVKLAREADSAARRLKEIGNVQNWAEVLERDFLVLEETIRLANDDRSCSCSDCGSYSGSGSESGGEDEGERAMDLDDADERGKSIEVNKTLGAEMEIDTENHAPGTFSDASRSMTEAESSVGRSMSTMSR